MDQAFYKEYFHIERTHWWFRSRALIIADMITKVIALPKNSSILNVGAATGQSSLLLAQFGTVKSLEYDATCCQITKETLGIDIVQGSILDLPYPDDSFDLVCCFDVIEHVEDHYESAQELKRVCKPGGYIIITVPAFNFLWSEHDDINQHYRRYTRPALEPLFKDGLKQIFVSYFNCLLFLPIAAFRIISRLFPKRKSLSRSGSDNSISSGYWSNLIFFPILRSEKYFLGSRISFPFGVSLMGIWQKL